MSRKYRVEQIELDVGRNEDDATKTLQLADPVL
jgi:hypothetical protein